MAAVVVVKVVVALTYVIRLLLFDPLQPLLHPCNSLVHRPHWHASLTPCLNFLDTHLECTGSLQRSFGDRNRTQRIGLRGRRGGHCLCLLLLLLDIRCICSSGSSSSHRCSRCYNLLIQLHHRSFKRCHLPVVTKGQVPIVVKGQDTEPVMSRRRHIP